ncbi:UNVERIFIED_CONTAM: hypothetical protein HDU68_005573, partial [Siphonaria sp. JEL0065]
MVGMYTGAATVNGQGWIEGVDYSQATLHLAFTIKEAEDEGYSHIKQEAGFALLELFVRLCLLCGLRLVALLRDNVVGIGRAFAAVAANTPEAEPVIKALEGVESLSNVSQVALILKAVFNLACTTKSLSVRHFGLIPLSTPQPVNPANSVLNDLQIYLRTTRDVVGVMFGWDFCNSSWAFSSRTASGN